MKLHMYLLHTAYVFGADEIALNHKYDEYQWGLASMISKIFHTKIGSGVNVNEVLTQELHKPVIKKVYLRFKEYIWVADLGEMGPLSSKNWVVEYLFCQLFSLICIN